MSMAGLVLLALLVAIVVPGAIVIFVVRRLRQNAAAAGYSGVGAYLRAVPRNDEEKRQAVDLALEGRNPVRPRALLPSDDLGRSDSLLLWVAQAHSGLARSRHPG